MNDTTKIEKLLINKTRYLQRIKQKLNIKELLKKLRLIIDDFSDWNGPGAVLV